MLASEFNELPCLLHIIQCFPIIVSILPQQFYISVPWICADTLPSAASRQSCFDKLDRARWQKCDSLIPSLHSSQQDMVSSGAVFFEQGCAQRF